jgi:hypothetical protein
VSSSLAKHEKSLEFKDLRFLSLVPCVPGVEDKHGSAYFEPEQEDSGFT